MKNTVDQAKSDSKNPDFLWSVRVYYEDTDAGGIVYYANYLKFFERARSEWLRTHNLEQQHLAHTARLFFVVRRVTTDYLQPARLDDALTVSVTVEKMGRVAVEFFQQIHRGQELLVECRTKVGCVSADSLKPIAIPEPIRDRLQGA